MTANLQYNVDNELGLNLRTEPVVKQSTRKAVMPNGHLVTKIRDAEKPGWFYVATTLQGVNVEGYASKRFLKPVAEFVQPAAVSGITEVHLPTSQAIRRNATSGRAFPLNEPNQETRDPGADAAAKRGAFGRIIDWLAVEQSLRYKKVPGTTFCNIYAYDYCHLGGVYMPRVWWKPTALVKLQNGQQVAPKYDVTVSELNANSLFRWFGEFGGQFGWMRVFDLTELQEAANDGRAAIITGVNKVANKSGHIAPVVPETSTQRAVRSAGQVTKPLQSQAGATNHEYKAWVWWTMSTFKDFAFYVNA